MATARSLAVPDVPRRLRELAELRCLDIDEPRLETRDAALMLRNELFVIPADDETPVGKLLNVAFGYCRTLALSPGEWKEKRGYVPGYACAGHLRTVATAIEVAMLDDSEGVAALKKIQQEAIDIAATDEWTQALAAIVDKRLQESAKPRGEVGLEVMAELLNDRTASHAHHAHRTKLFPKGTKGMDQNLIDAIVLLDSERGGKSSDMQILREFMGEPVNRCPKAKKLAAKIRKARQTGRTSLPRAR